MPRTSLEIVDSWIAAVNAIDADRAASLTTPSVRIVGPRGVAEGHTVLRQWIAHAGASFNTHAGYARGQAVVLAQRAEWRDVTTGEVTGVADVATRFVVQPELIAEIQRYDDLTTALTEAGLTSADLRFGVASPAI